MSTLTVYAGTIDGYIRSNSTTYAVARATGDLLANTSDTNHSVGQKRNAASDWDVFEAFIQFDTSSLGAGASISAVVLSLWMQNNFPTDVFDIQARLHDWGTGLTTADWVGGDSLSGKTLLAHKSVSGLPDGAYFDLVDDAFPANVNKTGATRILLDSSRQISANAPTGSFTELAVISSADVAGTTEDPKLVVT